ncbi:hypothetical protein HBH69_159650 [Parastagonospora nodorum]|nr:hypothetical protein HBH69_159650 [Parastagonospora nodorum]
MLTVTPIKDNDNLLNTINSHIKLRKLKEKHLKVREADALKQISINVREEENKNCSSLYYSNSNSNTATRKTRIKAYSPLDSNNYCLDSSLDINPKNNLEDEEATTAKDLLIGAYILYFKELLSNNGKIFASNTFTLRTRQKCKMPKQKIAIDPVNSILCDLSDLLVIRFCIFSNSALENIGILTNKEIVEMQTNTTTALANKLAAVNKLVRLQTFTLKILEHVETFIIVCSFRKIDKHIFRAYNTISVTAQQTIIRKGGSYIEKKRQTVFDKFYNCKLEGIIIAKFY